MAVATFREQLESREWKYGETTLQSVTRVFLCPRSTCETMRPKVGDHWGKAPVIEGGSPITTDTTDGVLCKSVAVRGMGDAGDTGTVRITCEYSNDTKTATELGGAERFDFQEWTLDVTVEQDVVNGVMNDATGRPSVLRYFRVPKAVLSVTQRRCKRINTGRVLSMVGKYNSVAFCGAPAGSLMFDGCRIHKDGKHWVHDFQFTYFRREYVSTTGAQVVEMWNDFYDGCLSGTDFHQLRGR